MIWYPCAQMKTMEQHFSEYRQMQDSKTAAMQNKTKQKLYRVLFNIGSLQAEKLILAGSKADAKKLARVGRVTRVEIA